MSFDINQYTAQLRERADKARADHERKLAALAKREPIPKIDYFGTVANWWSSQPPKSREHPWSLKNIAAAAFAESPSKPSIQHVAEALRQLGFTECRDWTRAGRNRRFWSPPITTHILSPLHL